MINPLVVPIKKIDIKDIRTKLSMIDTETVFDIPYHESEEMVVVRNTVHHPNAHYNRNEVFDFLMKMEG